MAAEKKTKPGIVMKRSKVSMAFSLITFMVGELIFVEKELTLPVNIPAYSEIKKKQFIQLQNKVLGLLKEESLIHLTLKESILLYIVVDSVCRSMVADDNETLIDLAEKNLEINRKDYSKLRTSYLQYAQTLLSEMNEKFSEKKNFKDVTEQLRSH